GCVLAYDSITSQPVPSIREVAAYLNLTVDVSVLEEIAAETGIERMRELSKWSEESAGATMQEGSYQFNRETLLHRNHIQDGRSGYGAQLLSANERRAVESMLAGRR